MIGLPDCISSDLFPILWKVSHHEVCESSIVPHPKPFVLHTSIVVRADMADIRRGESDIKVRFDVDKGEKSKMRTIPVAVRPHA